MKFTTQLSIPRINVSGYRSAVDEHMREVIAQAVSVWLEAVLMEIPVWSGASRATFQKLAQGIGYNLPIGPAAVDAAHGLFNSRIDRTAIGRASGDGKVTTDKGEYTFTYSTTLPWLIWNAYHNANVDPDPSLFDRLLEPGPYNFQVKGARAFLQFAANVDLPAVKPFVYGVRVKT